jgi:hypothetical protein
MLNHGVGAIPKAQRCPSTETSLSTKNRSLVANRPASAWAFGVTLTSVSFGSSSVQPCSPKRASVGSPSRPGQIAEGLIEGAVFANDEEDVLEAGHFCAGHERRLIVAHHGRGGFREGGFVERQREHGKAA